MLTVMSSLTFGVGTIESLLQWESRQFLLAYTKSSDNVSVVHNDITC